MVKILLFIRYTIRLSIFIGLFIPMVFIAYPCFFLFDAINSPHPSDWVANDIMREFFNLVVWGE